MNKTSTLLPLLCAFFCLYTQLFGQDSTIQRLPMRLIPKVGSSPQNYADSISTTQNCIKKTVDYIDKGNYNYALASINDAILCCPRGDAELLCEAKIYFVQVSILLNSFDRARRIIEEIDAFSCVNNNNYLKAINYYNRGLLCFKHNKHENSYAYLISALEIFEKLNNKPYIANIYNILSNNRESFTEKIEYVRKAISINYELKRDYNLLNNYNTLAIHYYDYGEYSKALVAADSAKLYINPNTVSGYNGNNYDILAQIYAKLGNFKSAYEVLDAKSQLKQRSINEAETIMLIDNYISSRDRLKNEKIIEYQKINFNSRLLKLTLVIVISILILIIIIITFVLINTKKNKKMQDLELIKISIEKDSISAKNELTNLATYLTTRNDIINNIQNNLKEILKEKGDIYDKVKKLYISLRSIKENNEEFEQLITRINRDFINKLCFKHPELTKSDKNLACMLRANLSTKQIASILNISDSSVNMARYRMRKNMKLDNQVKLFDYLNSL